MGLIKKLFGTSHDRMMRKLQPQVDAIRAREADMEKLTDEELQGLTAVFKERLANGESVDSLLTESFAAIREASKRVLGMRHYDVQMVGGIVLHRGMIAEMRTGEGKTLVATCPMYLNALTGEGAHLVTVNDYLAARDADWMGQIYRFMGLSVGTILTDMSNDERRRAYGCDITYGTNNEFGFDYLRDNMQFRLEDYVQRGHAFAIVDEVDSILIDEARTPLIISGQIEQDLNLYYEINKIIPFLLRDEDYTVDEKKHSAALTEQGIEKVENFLKVDNIYDPNFIEYLHHVNKALQAHTLYKKDQNYVVQDNQVIIVDDFTGRLMPGRRWSDGLHQAVEAKEGVEVRPENRTLATITFQNYFRMYKKLSGMTGTADTEAEEFKKIYKLDVVVIPTNKPIMRKDHPDVIYRTERVKIAAVVDQILECHKKGQPVLVGTVNVEKSEMISKVLSKRNIEHDVLNAKNHKREAEIVAQAGRKGRVTIATNMAGRGTDILLGGNPEFLAKRELGDKVDQHSDAYEKVYAKYAEMCAKEKKEVLAAGGLFILGTERHESRRIDNQLRGRSGRQGDPGESRFILSLEDDLLRIFNGEAMSRLMVMIRAEEDMAIESPMVSRAIENSQKQVEGRNFEQRKNLIEYDDVMNAQRNAIYFKRAEVLEGKGMRDQILDTLEEVILHSVNAGMPDGIMPEDWNTTQVFEELSQMTGRDVHVDALLIRKGDKDKISRAIWEQLETLYDEKCAEFQEVVDFFDRKFGEKSPYAGKKGEDLANEYAQNVLLKEVDRQWRDHLNDMTAFRESVTLRAHAHTDPKQEYKRVGYDMFVSLLHNIRVSSLRQIFRVIVEKPSEQDFAAQPAQPIQPTVPNRPAQNRQKRPAAGLQDLLPKSIRDAMRK